MTTPALVPNAQDPSLEKLVGFGGGQKDHSALIGVSRITPCPAQGSYEVPGWNQTWPDADKHLQLSHLSSCFLALDAVLGPGDQPGWYCESQTLRL